MAKIIGIDLGTTNSCVAVMEGGEAVVIPNSQGGRTTPSVVAFTPDDGRLVGQPAKNQAVMNAKNTISSIKGFMGRRHSEVTAEEKIVPYEVVGNAGDDCRVKISDGEHAPPEISAMVLQDLKRTAEEYLGEEVTEAVVTVPAYFNDAQRQATRDAGRIAGLDVQRIINEPTAASLAYGLDKNVNEKIAVFDLGGGTFDVSVLEVGDNVVEVRSTNGDTHLGGDDFDKVLIDWMVDEFKKENNIDLSVQADALQRLKEAAEKAKIELSGGQQAELNLPFITADQTGPKHLQLKLTLAAFEQMVEHLVDRTAGPCRQALSDAGLQPGEIDEVLLVGGSTRMPAVQAKVAEVFGKEPNRGVNPDEVVAVGAAIQGGVLSGEVRDVLLLDVTPLSLGIETMGGVMTTLIERNITIPSRKEETFSTAADNQTAVTVHVLQGERPRALDNRTLGRFDLVGIPPAPRGIPKIDVVFDIDKDGIVHVSAKDQATGAEQKIKVDVGSGLSEEEIDRMVSDSEAHAEEDTAAREVIELQNQADSLVYQTDKTLAEHGDKISDDDRAQVEEALKNLKDVQSGSDTEAITAAIEALTQASYKLAEAMYQSASAEGEADPAAGGPAPGPGPEAQPEAAPADDGGAVDASYEVIDDEEKK